MQLRPYRRGFELRQDAFSHAVRVCKRIATFAGVLIALALLYFSWGRPVVVKRHLAQRMTGEKMAQLQGGGFGGFGFYDSHLFAADIKGNRLAMERFKGQVLYIANVASY